MYANNSRPSDPKNDWFKDLSLELYPDSPVPLYYQLSRYLEKSIQDEIFKTGERFPSEQAISEFFNVSRPTANKAVQILLDEGWLYRDKQDKRSGTYVREKPHICLNFLTEGLSFADQFTPDVPLHSEILSKKIIPATEKAAKKLKIEVGQPIFYMRRLRFAYDQPIMVCDSKISSERFPGIEDVSLVQESLYKTLGSMYDCPILTSERDVVAEEAVDFEIIKHLGIPPFSSLLKLSGVSFTHDETPIDFLETFLHPCVSISNKIDTR
jgi:GntR family transcriptional regulator